MMAFTHGSARNDHPDLRKAALIAQAFPGWIFHAVACMPGIAACKKKPRTGGASGVQCNRSDYSNGTSNRATMLMILISGLTAGPAVSL